MDRGRDNPRWQRGPRSRGAAANPRANAPAPTNPGARAGLVLRVAAGSTLAVAVMVAGIWLTADARRLVGTVTVARPDLLEVGVRSAGIAVMAAAQLIARSAVVGRLYRTTRRDRMFEWGAAAVLTVAAVGAVAFGLSGW